MRSIEMSTASNRLQEPTFYQSVQTILWSVHEKLLSYTFAAPRGIAPGIDLEEERCESKKPP